jgi:aspartate/methionine/tyrosine aminotransferase
MAAVAEVEVQTGLLGAISERAKPENSVDGAWSADFQAKMAAALAEFGGDAFPLSGGDPDLPTPQHICDAAQKAIADGEHHYTDKAGIQPLRAAISAHILETDGLEYSEDEIVVTTGVQQALMSCFLALVAEGDEILVSAPTYRAYENQAAMVGADVVEIPTFPETGFIVTPEALEAAIPPRTKVFVHVSPNNPSGVVTPPEVVKELAAVAQKHDLVVLSDEIYSDMLYDGIEHLSIASLPGMKERTVVLKGCSKAYAMTGWRVGYMAAPAEFCKITTTMAGQMSLSVSTPSQHAALAGEPRRAARARQTASLLVYLLLLVSRLYKASCRQVALALLPLCFGLVAHHMPSSCAWKFSVLRVTGLHRRLHGNLWRAARDHDGHDGATRLHHM